MCYNEEKPEDAYPLLISCILKTIKDIKKNSKEKKEAKKNLVKKLDLSQLCDQAEVNIQKAREEKVLAWEIEIKKQTEEVAMMFKDRIADILKLIECKAGYLYSNDINGFEEYGTPNEITYKLSDEKFEAIFDFSDKYHTRDVVKTLEHRNPLTNDYMPHYPKTFAYGRTISWSYLEELLEKQNIKINHIYEEKSKRISYDDSLKTVTDIITVTVERKVIKDKTPVIIEEPQKVKTKRKNIFPNLSH